VVAADSILLATAKRVRAGGVASYNQLALLGENSATQDSYLHGSDRASLSHATERYLLLERTRGSRDVLPVDVPKISSAFELELLSSRQETLDLVRSGAGLDSVQIGATIATPLELTRSTDTDGEVSEYVWRARSS